MSSFIRVRVTIIRARRSLQQLKVRSRGGIGQDRNIRPESVSRGGDYRAWKSCSSNERLALKTVKTLSNDRRLKPAQD